MKKTMQKKKILFIDVMSVHSLSSKVETELKSICNDILDVLEKYLIPSSTSGESKVFYYKMYGLLFPFPSIRTDYLGYFVSPSL